MLNIEELKTRVEQHLAEFANQVDERFRNELRQFATWLESKQADDARAADYAQWLTAHGYTVTKN